MSSKEALELFLRQTIANNSAFTSSWSGADTKTTIGGANSSSNYYWVADWFTSSMGSTYSGTLTTTLNTLMSAFFGVDFLKNAKQVSTVFLIKQ